MSNTPETSRRSALEFTPEERAEADGSWVDMDQWAKRDGATPVDKGEGVADESDQVDEADEADEVNEAG